ncbi:hypothetical protein JW756_04175 [Candidatus Woesearchaeota archaeon]|nr:hypothetical protein [Candidatus Woesearchaeota archaeon]
MLFDNKKPSLFSSEQLKAIGDLLAEALQKPGVKWEHSYYIESLLRVVATALTNDAKFKISFFVDSPLKEKPGVLDRALQQPIRAFTLEVNGMEYYADDLDEVSGFDKLMAFLKVKVQEICQDILAAHNAEADSIIALLKAKEPE